MTLTVVPPRAQKQPPRVGLWTKISVSLIVAGVLALALSGVLGLRWYYGLDRLHSNAQNVSVTMTVGRTYLIDERLSSTSNGSIVDVRAISVRYDSDPPGNVADVRLCRVGESPCLASQPFTPGKLNLSVDQILVRIVPKHPGTIVVSGVEVSYRQGVRHATQHLGSKVTVTVLP